MLRENVRIVPAPQRRVAIPGRPGAFVPDAGYVVPVWDSYWARQRLQGSVIVLSELPEIEQPDPDPQEELE